MQFDAPIKKTIYTDLPGGSATPVKASTPEIQMHNMQGRVLRGIYISLQNMDVKVATAAGVAVIEDAVFRFLKNIKVQVNGKDICNMPAYLLKYLNMFANGILPALAVPSAATAATYSDNSALVYVPVADPFSKIPWGAIDTNKHRVTVQVEYNTNQSAVAAADNYGCIEADTSTAVTIDSTDHTLAIIGDYVVPPAAFRDDFIHSIARLTESITSSNSDFAVSAEIPSDCRVLYNMFFSAEAVSNFAKVAAVTEMKSIDIGGTTVIEGLSLVRHAEIGQNETGVADATGVTLLNFDPDGNILGVPRGSYNAKLNITGGTGYQLDVLIGKLQAKSAYGIA